ncbi:hypothetical protein Tsubulata_022430 [Turnera subulata]|uniref:Nicotianamine synthase n=1 Tax=Turnera subulata TaxID=218843 RepID=A0A9Q0FM17_9ROSI|nr:hypothetical protein Tsubulata_022430 [Turnera subulata]
MLSTACYPYLMLLLKGKWYILHLCEKDHTHKTYKGRAPSWILETTSSTMAGQEELVIRKICEIYYQLSKLQDLNPSKQVDSLFNQLVLTCKQPSNIDVANLRGEAQEIRPKLIKLCGTAEGLLESHFSTLIGSQNDPLRHLRLFPYYSNYLKLTKIEFNMLREIYDEKQVVPKQVAFVGSGPLPLTSIILATNHLKATCFHNYDMDASANAKALKLVSSDPGLSKRMFFHTTNIMNVSSALSEYEIVILAALVGMEHTEKVNVIKHLAKHMAPGAILLLRSAHGARGFLYPVIDPRNDLQLQGFRVLSIFHPTDDVINSVVVAVKA